METKKAIEITLSFLIMYDVLGVKEPTKRQLNAIRHITREITEHEETREWVETTLKDFEKKGTLICPGCYNEFVKDYPNQKYCSNACKIKNNRKNKG
ncbi:MAG: hypothetical protein ABFS35_19155 [Bacteroidota bacterium]